jgi:hypothetical protein
MLNRPHAYILKECTLKFSKVPFKHKPLKMIIPNIVFPIPLNNGHVCYLTLPSNYNKYDLKIIEQTLYAHFTVAGEVEDEQKKTVLGQYIDRVVKKKSIGQVHY